MYKKMGILSFSLIMLLGLLAWGYSSSRKPKLLQANLPISLVETDRFPSEKLQDFGYGGYLYKVQVSKIRPSSSSFNKNILITYDLLNTLETGKEFILKSLEKGSHVIIETDKRSPTIITALGIDRKDVMPNYDNSFGNYSAAVSIFKFKGKYYIANMGFEGIAKFSKEYYQSLLTGFLYDKEKFIPGYKEAEAGASPT